MNEWGKDVIFKDKPIVSVPDYDNDDNSKKKERKYKTFSYGKATMKKLFYFILKYKKLIVSKSGFQGWGFLYLIFDHEVSKSLFYFTPNFI